MPTETQSIYFWPLLSPVKTTVYVTDRAEISSGNVYSLAIYIKGAIQLRKYCVSHGID